MSATKENRVLNTGAIQIVLLGLLVAGIYYSTFEWLVVKDWARDDYSHGMLMPFIVLYLLWEKKNWFFDVPAKINWQGFLILVPGLCLFWMGDLAGEYFMLYFSCWLVVMGLCWIHMGLYRIKNIWFPLCISLAMFPLPNFLNVKLTFQLRLISSKLGVAMMRLYGMSAYREGNVIDLGFTKLQVVDACSGLRYLFPMLILSILMAYFYKSRLWKKAVLVLSSIPLTIVTNAFRIALTGILSEKFGSAVVEGFFHDFEGWLIFMVTLGVLMGEMWILNRLFPEPGGADNEDQDDEEDAVPVEVEPVKSGLLQPQFLVSVVLLGLTLILSRGVEFRPAIPMVRPFAEFPMAIDGWRGAPTTMEEQFVEALDFSDYIMADYTDGKGAPIDFYVAYYENQQKGESIHSPATCLRGGGWVFKESGKALVPLGDGRVLPVSRALIQNGPYQQISYYWFPMRGRMLTNAFEMKWFNFWDALTRQRTDGALVRVIVPVGQGESAEAAEKRLQGFLRAVVPVLDEYLPK
ncbi:MAG: VPLPA-CTERM-specific exosortase XrtD [Desulfobacter sp.]|nr:MAG: VPLPA-CTERM-specific exosortase XrtD [Desulfobacter sp.]